MTRQIVFENGRVLSPADISNGSGFQQAFVVSEQSIAYVGNNADDQIQLAKKEGAEVVDLKNRVVVPAFIDSHTHFLLFGLALQKLDLSNCKTFVEIEAALVAYAKAHPKLPRILCRGWHQPSTSGKALAEMIDHIDSRPIFIEALDLHSTWCNTPAMKEMNIWNTPSPPGGTIHRDENDAPSGLLDESAQTGIVWPHLMGVCSTEERLQALKDALRVYTESGYTGLIDMAMDGGAWEALQLLRKQQKVPIHIAAHWYIPFTDNTEELAKHVDEAIAKHREFHPSVSPEFCVVGIKIISDGVIDGCTAALSHPYGDSSSASAVSPIWPPESMNRVIKRAAEAGLQVAIHAVGDVAVKVAIDSIAAANTPNGRHRIEHLELASTEDAMRLGKLGITASVQPVHSDPVLTKAYPRILQPHLWERAFPYKEYLEGHACLAIGTDAPTARHLPLPNLYNATVRRSAIEPESLLATNPGGGISLLQAITAATSGVAYSRFAEAWVGSIVPGHRADFVVLNTEWTPESLLEASVHQTWAAGEMVYEK